MTHREILPDIFLWASILPVLLEMKSWNWYLTLGKGILRQNNAYRGWECGIVESTVGYVVKYSISFLNLTFLTNKNLYRLDIPSDFPISHGFIPQPNLMLPGAAKVVHKLIAKYLSRDTFFPHKPLCGLLQALG